MNPPDTHARRSPAAQVRVGFWDSPRREQQSTEDRLAQIYYLSTPYRSVIGVFQVNMRTAASHLGWDRPQLEMVTARLENQGEVAQENGWIWVKCWWDYNSPPGPGWDMTIKELLTGLPENLRQAWFVDADARGLPISRWTIGGSTPPSTPDTTPDSTGANTTDNNNIKINKSTTTKTKQNKRSGSENLDLSRIPLESRDSVLKVVMKCTEFDRQDVIDLTALAIFEKRVEKNAERYANGIVQNALAGVLDTTALPSYRLSISKKLQNEKAIKERSVAPLEKDPIASANGAMMIDKIRRKRSSNQMGAQK